MASLKPKNGSNGTASSHSQTATASRAINSAKRKNGSHEISYQDDVLDSRQLLQILTEVKNGNFGVRMPIDQVGINGKICDTLNEIISLNEILMLELTQAGQTIGKKGNLTHRI